MNSSVDDLLRIDGWNVWPSDVPEVDHGGARLRRVTYEPGRYEMFGVAGFRSWCTEQPLAMTSLELARWRNNAVSWATWQTNDPPHWYAMTKEAEAAEGHVLVVGLGLGVAVCHLLDNPRVTSIDVLEGREDVIYLLQLHLERINSGRKTLSFYTADLGLWMKYRSRNEPPYACAIFNVQPTPLAIRIDC